MKIDKELIIAFECEGVEYVSKVNTKGENILFEDGTWEADVDCDKAVEGYGYPYMTIWGRLNEEGVPTTKDLHGLLNFENHDIRICNHGIRIVQCS